MYILIGYMNGCPDIDEEEEVIVAEKLESRTKYMYL